MATLPEPVRAYYDNLDEPHRETMLTLRAQILAVVPEAHEAMSYGCPAFVVDGRRVAGLASFARHIGYLPHSGSTLAELADLVGRRTHTKSSLHVPVGESLPDDLVRALVQARLDAKK